MPDIASAALLSSCCAPLHHAVHHYIKCTQCARVQGLYGAGFLGGLGLALTQARTQCLAICNMLCQNTLVKSVVSLQPEPVTQYVASHPGAVWLVGPLFAAVTGAECTPAIPRVTNTGGVSVAPDFMLALSTRQKLLCRIGFQRRSVLWKG